MLFSERNGYTEKIVLKNNISEELENRVLNSFRKYLMSFKLGFKEEVLFYRIYDEYFGDFIGNNRYLIFSNLYAKYKSREKNWFELYDFIEFILSTIKELAQNSYESSKANSNIRKFEEELNIVLKKCNTAYQIINGKVISIIGDEEIDEVEKAIHTKYGASKHISNAIELFSKRPNPDYNNSVKESISAVESICKAISNKPKATLGDALKEIEDKGYRIHGALKSGYNAIYGYTSDEDGIRHAGIEYSDVDEYTARYMLVSYSAFVNYLISVWEQN